MLASPQEIKKVNNFLIQAATSFWHKLHFILACPVQASTPKA
jgi:hypothetical protein